MFGSCVCLVCPAPPGVFEPVSPPTVTTWSPKWQGAKEGKPGYTLHEGYASSSHRRAWPCTQHDLGGAVRRGLDFCPSLSHRTVILTARVRSHFVHQWVSVSVVLCQTRPVLAVTERKVKRGPSEIRLFDEIRISVPRASESRSRFIAASSGACRRAVRDRRCLRPIQTQPNITCASSLEFSRTVAQGYAIERCGAAMPTAAAARGRTRTRRRDRCASKPARQCHQPPLLERRLEHRCCCCPPHVEAPSSPPHSPP